jgi:enoyl-CoA hydratase/carnithine racemase
MTSTAIRWTVEDHVGTIMICREAKKNALSESMWGELGAVARVASSTEGLRCVVLRGEGTVFSAGADIVEFLDMVTTPKRFEENQRIIDSAVEAVASIPVPTVAAVSGACVGGGLAIALACDLRVADQSATFGLTPARLGLVYGANDTARLLMTVGASAAKRLLLTADIVSAETALDMGLVSEVVVDLNVAVEALVARIAALSSYSTRAAKRMLDELVQQPVVSREDLEVLRIRAIDEPDTWQRLERFRQRNGETKA